jgi:ubiquinone/menaquinone biosynthesis C-methylase UbiE
LTDTIAPKPTHLGPEYGAQFSDESIVRAYHHRPPYPDELFTLLTGLMAPGPATILDAGCGSGDIVLGLLAHVPQIERLDAVDLSAGMVAEGQRRLGGDDPRVNWQVAPIEMAHLYPPYALITAGESLHWMDWPVVMPRFRDALSPGGVVAIAGRSEQPSVWSAELLRIVQRYSTNRDFQPYNVVDELTTRLLFTVLGSRTTASITHTQSFASYVESWHSRNGLSRDRMTLGAAEAFDRDTRALLAGYGYEESVTFDVVGSVTWGLPDG